MRWLPLIGCLWLGCDKLPELGPSDAAPSAPSEAALLKQRSYTPLIPPGYSADRKWPLILVLHGYGGSGQQTLDGLRLTELQDRVLMVAPEGLRDSRGNDEFRFVNWKGEL